jgi:ketosteroid isomerase-like protein
MSRPPAILSLVLVLAATPTLAQTTDVSPGQARVPTVTRLVKIFSELEGDLATRLENGDAATVAALLTEDFEMRAGPAPGSPTPRADWIRESMAKPVRSARFEQMAVHDLGEFAVVSFVQLPGESGARDPAARFFVVDVWKRAGDAWRLAIRYIGPVGRPDLLVPGIARQPATPPKRY